MAHIVIESRRSLTKSKEKTYWELREKHKDSLKFAQAVSPHYTLKEVAFIEGKETLRVININILALTIVWVLTKLIVYYYTGKT